MSGERPAVLGAGVMGTAIRTPAVVDVGAGRLAADVRGLPGGGVFGELLPELAKEGK